MRQYKEKIHIHLFECQRRYGDYTGKDLDDIARIFGFNRRTLKRYVEKWSKTDPLFAELRYIGKSFPLTSASINLPVGFDVYLAQGEELAAKWDGRRSYLFRLRR